MTLNSTQIRLILSSFVALVFIGLLIFGAYRLRAENQKTGELLSLSRVSEKEEEVARIISGLRENASTEIAALEALGVYSETLVPTIESIESAGQKLGLSTEIASVERGDGKGQPAQTIKITVNSRGSWKGNFSLLKALESLPQRVVIESAKISKVETAWRSQITLLLQPLD